MTDTEAKALALVNDVEGGPVNRQLAFKRTSNSTAEALCRAIERLEATEARHAAELREQAERFDAFRQEVSDAVEGFWNYCRTTNTPFPADLDSFIIPAPDPLVEDEDPIDALVDLLAPVLTHSQGMAARERENRFRNAIAALRAQQKDTNA